jgi:hypothetical protein
MATTRDASEIPCLAGGPWYVGRADVDIARQRWLGCIEQLSLWNQ